MTDKSTLFFLSAECHNGDSQGPVNMDLFVFALSHDDAFKAWRDHYDGWDMPEEATVRAVPTYSRLGAVPWDLLVAIAYRVT